MQNKIVRRYFPSRILLFLQVKIYTMRFFELHSERRNENEEIFENSVCNHCCDCALFCDVNGDVTGLKSRKQSVN